MSAFAVPYQHEPLPPYSDPDPRILRLGDHPCEPDPEYSYNPVTELGIPPADRNAPRRIISALRFNPPEHITAQMITDLCRPDTSLVEVADRAGTSMESLSLWMLRPDIAERLNACEAAAVRRARLSILTCVPLMIDCSARMMREYQESESDIHGPAMKTIEVGIRNRTAVLAAQKFLVKLYERFTPKSEPSGASRERKPQPETHSRPQSEASGVSRRTLPRTATP